MVLMVTALGESGDIERAVAAGCNDFLSKPINKLDFLKRVEILLELRHVKDELDRLRRYIDEMERDRPKRKPDGVGKEERERGRKGEGGDPRTCVSPLSPCSPLSLSPFLPRSPLFR